MVAQGQESIAHFEDPNYSGNAITAKTLALNVTKSTNISIILDSSGYIVNTVTDNKSKTYTVTNNSFELLPSEGLIVTASFKEIPNKAYAYISTSSGGSTNDTLTFTYDGKMDEKDIAFEVEDTGTSLPGWAQYVGREKAGTVKKVVFEESFKNVRPKSCFCWFDATEKKNSSITEFVNIKYLHTDEVSSMKRMFSYNDKITSLPDVT